ncbi:unnamed protein product, partial [Brassica oleracea var. botrytis]
LFRERCQSRSRSRYEKQKAGVETVENERVAANSILKGVCFLGLHNWSRERTTILLTGRWQNLFRKRCQRDEGDMKRRKSM